MCGVPTNNSQLARAVWAVALIAWFAISATLGAEGSSGVITFNGLPVPGATITAMRGDTRQKTVSGPDGSYRFEELTNGAWTLEVSMLGFAPVVGSSRVDLQACKLEYSIVSPK